jgi:hypothetical protein
MLPKRQSANGTRATSQRGFRAVPGARDNAKPCPPLSRSQAASALPIAQVAVTKIWRHQNWQQNRLLMRRFGAKWKMGRS